MTTPQKSGSSLGCCLLKILGVCALFALVLCLGFGFMAWRAYSWTQNMHQPAPVSYPPLAISEVEKQDAAGVRTRLEASSKNNSLIDETVTPMVLNGLLESLLKDDTAQGKVKTIRVGFDGDHMKAEITWKDYDEQGQIQYYNIAATFDADIQDSKITKLKLHNLSSGGREAPILVTFLVNRTLDLIALGVNNADSNKDPNAKVFEAFKVFKREGDRLHIKVDPAKFQEAKKAAEKKRGHTNAVNDDDDKDDKDDKSTTKKQDF